MLLRPLSSEVCLHMVAKVAVFNISLNTDYTVVTQGLLQSCSDEQIL